MGVPVFSGRAEALYTVPTGGATVAVSSGALTSAVNVTLAAGDYFHTTAGGVSSGITTWQTAINAALSPYANNATSAATMLGYGDFSTGAAWLMQETSGDLAAAFGSPTLTATSLTYSNTGPGRGGDLAIGFSAAGSNADGGNVFDVTATDDLIVAWVGYESAIPAASYGLVTKFTTSGWNVQYGNGTIAFNAFKAGAVLDFNMALTLATAGAWYVGIATIDRSTGKARLGIQYLTSGTQNISTEQTATASSYSTAASFRVGQRADAGIGANTNAKVAGLYVVTGSGVATGLSANLSTALTNFANAINSAFTVSLSTTTGLTTISNSFWTCGVSWTSTDLRDLLGFTGTLSSATSYTSTKQARALWFPDSPLNCDQHPSMAPEDTDLRGTESPTGNVIGLSGNVKYIHENVRYMRCPLERIRENSATYANASLEVFFRDAISGLGAHAWLGPMRDLQFYWNNAGVSTLLGADANSGTGTAGWKPTGVSKFSELAKMSQEGYAGQFDVRFPRLVSDG